MPARALLLLSTMECPPTRTCLRHGELPSSRFYKEDVRRNRRRCKRCVADQVARWRERHPLRTLWRRFLQRARRRFGAATVTQLDWRSHGRPLLFRLVQAVDPEGDAGAPLLERYMLTWENASASLDLTQLFLQERRQLRGCGSRRASAAVVC